MTEASADPLRVGDDRGEKLRQVDGKAFTQVDATAFAVLLGIDPES